MAESTVAPDLAAGQGTGTGAAPSLPTDGTGSATVSDQGTQTASPSQPSKTEPDEVERVLSAGGPEAVKMGKHWQRVSSEKDNRLAQLKQAEDLFKVLGEGDVQRGMEATNLYLGQYNQVVTNPQARKAIQEFLRTGQWTPGGSMQTDDFGYGASDEPNDPTLQELKALRQELQEVRGGTALQQMKGYLEGFFRKEMAEGVSLSEILSDEEKTQIVSGLEGHIRRLSGNESGQQTLRNLNAQMVQQMMQLQIPPEQWVAIGEKAHLRKLEKKRGAATGAAPTGATSGNETRAYSSNLATAVEEFAREQGIDIWKLGT